MADVVLRNIDESVLEAHRRRAAGKGISLEQQLREVLASTARPSREERLRRMDEIRAMTPAPKPGERWLSAEELVREDRDSR